MSFRTLDLALVARGQEKYDSGGGLTDEPTRERVRQLLVALQAWTERMAGRP